MVLVAQLPESRGKPNRFSLASFIQKAKMAELRFTHQKSNPGEIDRITIGSDVHVTNLRPAEDSNLDSLSDLPSKTHGKGAAPTDSDFVMGGSTAQKGQISLKSIDENGCDIRPGIAEGVFLVTTETVCSTLDNSPKEMGVIAPNKGDCNQCQVHWDDKLDEDHTSKEHLTPRRPRVTTSTSIGKPSKATRRRHASTAERLSKSAFGHKSSRDDEDTAEMMVCANQRRGTKKQSPCVTTVDDKTPTSRDTTTESSGTPGILHSISGATTDVRVPTPLTQHADKSLEEKSQSSTWVNTRDNETHMPRVATREIETQYQTFHVDTIVQTLAIPSPLSVWNQMETGDKDTQNPSIPLIASVEADYQPELVEGAGRVPCTTPSNASESMLSRSDAKHTESSSAGSLLADDRADKAKEQSGQTGWWLFIPSDSQSEHTLDIESSSVPSHTAHVDSTENRVGHVSEARQQPSDTEEVSEEPKTTASRNTSIEAVRITRHGPHAKPTNPDTEPELSKAQDQPFISLDLKGVQGQLGNPITDAQPSPGCFTTVITTQCEGEACLIIPGVSTMTSPRLNGTRDLGEATTFTQSSETGDTQSRADDRTSTAWYISFTPPRWRPGKTDERHYLKFSPEKQFKSRHPKTNHFVERPKAETMLTDHSFRDSQFVIETLVDLVKLYISMPDSSVMTAEGDLGTDVVRDEVVCFLTRMRQEFGHSADVSSSRSPREQISPSDSGTASNGMLQPQNLDEGSDSLTPPHLTDTGDNEQNTELEAKENHHSSFIDNIDIDPESPCNINDSGHVDARFTMIESFVQLEKDDLAIFSDPEGTDNNEQIPHQNSESEAEQNIHSSSSDNLTAATSDTYLRCQNGITNFALVDDRSSRSESFVYLEKDDLTAFPNTEDTNVSKQISRRNSESKAEQNSHSSSNDNLTDATYDIDPECHCGLSDPDLVDVRSTRSEPFLRVCHVANTCASFTERRSLPDSINRICDTCQSMIISQLIGYAESGVEMSSAPIISARGASATWSAPIVPKESLVRADSEDPTNVACYEDENGWTIPDIRVPVIDKESITWNIAKNRLTPVVIGEGAFGDVKLAVYLNRSGWCSDVAIKVFNDTSDMIDIVREAKLLQYLQTTDVFPEFYGCLNMGTNEEPKLCLVQELFGDGKTLHNLIDEEHRNPYLKGTGWMSICIQLAKGLRKIHAKDIIFNDLKENNILVNAAAVIGRPVIKFIDVGISTFTHGVVLNDPAEQLEDMTYLAPEVRARAESTFVSDIYSLGKIYERIAVIGSIPGLHWVAMACCKSEPKKRMSLNKVTRYLVSIARCRKLFGARKSLAGRCRI